jgi:hypothetical protein
MAPSDATVHRQQELYWQQLRDLKAGCLYLERYRSILNDWETRIATVRAVASSGAIAGWAIVQAHPLLWGSIIAAAQVADALRHVFPLATRRQAASDLLGVLEGQFFRCLHEWESVRDGSLSDREINDRRLGLMEQQHQAQLKYFPTTGLPVRPALKALAEAEARDYLTKRFG